MGHWKNERCKKAANEICKDIDAPEVPSANGTSTPPQQYFCCETSWVWAGGEGNYDSGMSGFASACDCELHAPQTKMAGNVSERPELTVGPAVSMDGDTSCGLPRASLQRTACYTRGSTARSSVKDRSRPLRPNATFFPVRELIVRGQFRRRRSLHITRPAHLCRPPLPTSAPTSPPVPCQTAHSPTEARDRALRADNAGCGRKTVTICAHIEDLRARTDYRHSSLPGSIQDPRERGGRITPRHSIPVRGASVRACSRTSGTSSHAGPQVESEQPLMDGGCRQTAMHDGAAPTDASSVSPPPPLPSHTASARVRHNAHTQAHPDVEPAPQPTAIGMYKRMAWGGAAEAQVCCEERDAVARGRAVQAHCSAGRTCVGERVQERKKATGGDSVGYVRLGRVS
ncbi:hypothetical protein B0H10DRAFT_1938010 [Mycena sp. CBHHK59/15]|nr:hypothetical protein B0H10DRAFT_1938010 [Mycena sp. CBHHK59/15]